VSRVGFGELRQTSNDHLVPFSGQDFSPPIKLAGLYTTQPDVNRNQLCLFISQDSLADYQIPFEILYVASRAF